MPNSFNKISLFPLFGCQRQSPALLMFAMLLMAQIHTGCKAPSGRLASTSSEPSSSPPGPLQPSVPVPAATERPPPPPTSPPDLSLIACGEASYYGPGFEGNPTASGEIFNPSAITAAHPSLPFGTLVRVLPKGQKPRSDTDGVVVRINDRGPYFGGRIIDLSTAAFKRIMPLGRGHGQVCLYRED